MAIANTVNAISAGQGRITDHADKEAFADHLTYEEIYFSGEPIHSVAEFCTHCGERLYAENVVRSFEKIRGKLRKQEFSHFKSIG
jgi:hypothetical protein